MLKALFVICYWLTNIFLWSVNALKLSLVRIFYLTFFRGHLLQYSNLNHYLGTLYIYLPLCIRLQKDRGWNPATMANHVESIMYAVKYFYRNSAPKYHNVQLVAQLRAISTQLQEKGYFHFHVHIFRSSKVQKCTEIPVSFFTYNSCDWEPLAVDGKVIDRVGSFK